MSGTHSNKRQRTTSSLKDDRATKHKTRDRANAQGTNHHARTSASSVNAKIDEEGSRDAGGGRSLRPRQTECAVHSEDDDDSQDDSWKPGAEATKARVEQSLTKVLRAAHFLKCTDKLMVLFFRQIKLPICLENPPLAILCTKTHDHDDTCNVSVKGVVFASTVTQALLELYGRWEFHNARKYTAHSQIESETTALDIYIPITLTGSPIPWEAKPFKEMAKKQDGTRHIPKDYKPDRDIRKAWKWIRVRLISPQLLPQKFPVEWTSPDSSAPKIRPELPEAFVNLLKQGAPARETPPSPQSSSSLAATPVKVHGARLDGSFRQGATFKPLQLSCIREQTESLLSGDLDESGDISREPRLASPQILLPCFELDVSNASVDAGVMAEGNENHISHARPSDTSNSGDTPSPQTDTPDPPPKPEHELAYLLMRNHKLQYTEEDALCLSQYVEEERRKFDINRSKAKLCQFLSTVNNIPGDPNFVYVPKTEIEQVDQAERCGNAGKTEDATDVANSAMEINLRWLEFKGIDETDLKGKNPTSEMAMERRIGHLFDGLFTFAELQESANKPTKFLSYFQLFDTSPQPDYAVRPAPGEWAHWPDILRPVLASGDGKTLARDGAAQIACNSRAVIILQILMYLDTRPTADAALPGWMFNFSWIYTKGGFIIYVHYPSVKLLDNGEDWSWKMVSVMLTDEYSQVWDPRYSSISEYHRAKAAADIMVSHTDFVLDQIRKWSHSRGQYGDGSIMNQLIARAHYEEGNYEWLHRKVREEQELMKG